MNSVESSSGNAPGAAPQTSSKSGWASFWQVRFLPCLLVFLSAFCLMVMELVAPRLVARHLGSSIYTWTSVIGVVLAGLGLGNYIGGLLADRFPPRSLLPHLFFVSSALVLSTVWLNDALGAASELPGSFPFRVFLVITLVFFAPAAALGTISPVVAKMALEQSRRIGATIGNIYAWGQIGAIAGTFAAGYVLIAKLGSLTVIVLTSATLAVTGLCFVTAGIVHAIWCGATIAALVMAVVPASISWAVRAGEALRLRQQLGPHIVYFDESEYYTIKVETAPNEPSGVDLRVLVLDHLIHGYIHPTNPFHLQYEYERTYVTVLKKAGVLPENFELLTDEELDEVPPQYGRPVRALFIGGGSYTFPRFLEAACPDSKIVVAEIDPAVTEAAHRALFLPRDTTIEIIHGDARITVRRLVDEVRDGKRDPFDCVFGDAFNDFSVPWHLTTREFNEQIARLLTPDGLYMINIIDDYDFARFLGAYVNTARRTFPFVAALSTSPVEPTANRDTFVVVMSKKPLDLSDIPPATGVGSNPASKLSNPPSGFECYLLTEEQLRRAIERAGVILLTDDYAPVENLLAPVAADR